MTGLVICIIHYTSVLNRNDPWDQHPPGSLTAELSLHALQIDRTLCAWLFGPVRIYRCCASQLELPKEGPSIRSLFDLQSRLVPVRHRAIQNLNGTKEASSGTAHLKRGKGSPQAGSFSFGPDQFIAVQAGFHSSVPVCGTGVEYFLRWTERRAVSR